MGFDFSFQNFIKISCCRQNEFSSDNAYLASSFARTLLIADIDFQKLNFAKITAHSVERWNRRFSNAANASTTRAENTLDQAKIVPWNILQMPLK
jgi:hypothetical protein